MIDADTLAEAREWIAFLGLSKIEVFLVFVMLLIFWRLPVILQHRREKTAIDLEARRKSRALEAKIGREKERRGSRKGGS